MPHIYEFLYRGPTAHNRMTPVYHVILGDTVEALGKDREIISDAMTPTQASDAGYTLEVIQGEMAASLTLALDAEKAAHKKAVEEAERLSQNLGEAKAVIAKSNEAITQLANENQLAKNTIASLLADMTTLDEAVRVQALRADTAETKLNQAAQIAATATPAESPGIVSRMLALVGIGKTE